MAIGPVLLNNQFVKMSDWNIFGSGSLLYTYDLGTQDHDTIQAIGADRRRSGRLQLESLAKMDGGDRNRFRRGARQSLSKTLLFKVGSFQLQGSASFRLHNPFDSKRIGYKSV